MRAGVYARISNDRSGLALGVSRQLDDCRRLCEQRGWSVVEEYVDNDVSAYSGKHRPKYEAMLEDIRAGRLDAVVAYHQDRLTRSPREFEDFLAVCESAGVRGFCTVTGYTDLAEADGVMVTRIQAAVARNESDTKRRRIQSLNDAKASSGQPHVSGVRPFGYERDGMTIRQDEAAVVRELVTRFLAGESVAALTRWVNEQGVPTTTGRLGWRTNVVRNVLRSPRNAGLREHRGEIVGKAAWPAIITEEQHRRVLGVFADPTRRTNRSARRYSLSGMVFCAECGHKMHSLPSRGRRRYGCKNNPPDFNGCGHVYIHAEPLEAFIRDAVLTRLDGPEMARVLKRRQAANEDTAGLAAQIAADRDQLAELSAQWAANEIRMNEWQAARKVIDSRLSINERRLARMTDTDGLGALIGNGEKLRDRWDGLDASQQQSVFRAVLDRLLVHVAEGPTRTMNPNRIEPVWKA